MATESGGDETRDETGPSGPGTRPATRGRRRLVTNETAATGGGVMYMDEGELEFESTFAIFVWRALRKFVMADFEENVEETVGTTREAAGGDRVRRERDWGQDRRSLGRDRRQDGGDGW